MAVRAHFVAYMAGRAGHSAGDLVQLAAAITRCEAVLGNRFATQENLDVARFVRGMAVVERARVADETDTDFERIITDFVAIRDRVNEEMRAVADVILAMAYLERAQESQSVPDADWAVSFADDVLTRVPESLRRDVTLILAYALCTSVQAGTGGRAALDRAADLFGWVLRQPIDDPAVKSGAIGGMGCVMAYRLLLEGGSDADLDTAVDHLADAIAVTTPYAADRAFVLNGFISALMFRYQSRGDFADLRRCVDLIRDARGGTPLTGARRHLLDVMCGQILVLWYEATGDAEALSEAYEALTGCLAEVPSDSALRRSAMRALCMVDALRAVQDADSGGYEAAAQNAIRILAEVDPDTVDAVVVRGTAALTLQAMGMYLDDPGLMRSAIDAMEPLTDDRPGDPTYGRYLGGLGMSLLYLSKNGGTPQDLDKAVRHLARAYELESAQPSSPILPAVAMGLAEAYALTGDLAGAVGVGRSALRGRAWQVLLQTGTHHAMAAVRQGADNALTVARWCLRAGLPQAAREVLESGRGLVLHAATVTSSISDLLVAAGAADLAREWEQRLRDTPFGAVPAADDWRAGVPSLPPDLRHRALTALENHPLLFDPPTVPATTHALHVLRANALIYMFAGTGDNEGLALIVGADGGIDAMDLPELTGDWAGVAAMRQMTVVRDVPQEEPPAGGRWSDLEDVCAAAWNAVIGRLLDHWRTAHSGEPHFVLAPAGTLAMIPWHAACGPAEVDGTRRWAIDEAAFSYIASGRLLVEVAGRRKVPVGKAALVIGDPDTGFAGDDLPGAGEEAIAIHDRFYPEGTFHGRPAQRAAGPGVPEDVFGWLGGRDEPHAAVLHLACHGIVRADGPASSSLRLAGGAVVSAEQILHAAANRPPGTSLGVVCLAACTTHLSGRDYDEAVTLSTAFLVAGAGTAFGSLWRVPDRETKLLMVDLHENLAVRGLAPREALRAAQRRLRDEAQAGLASWAGFVHLGA